METARSFIGIPSAVLRTNTSAESRLRWRRAPQEGLVWSPSNLGYPDEPEGDGPQIVVQSSQEPHQSYESSQRGVGAGT